MLNVNPFKLAYAAVIVASPAEIPVTTPTLFTIATSSLLLDHVHSVVISFIELANTLKPVFSMFRPRSRSRQ